MRKNKISEDTPKCTFSYTITYVSSVSVGFLSFETFSQFARWFLTCFYFLSKLHDFPNFVGRKHCFNCFPMISYIFLICMLVGWKFMFFRISFVKNIVLSFFGQHAGIPRNPSESLGTFRGISRKRALPTKFPLKTRSSTAFFKEIWSGDLFSSKYLGKFRWIPRDFEGSQRVDRKKLKTMCLTKEIWKKT